MRHSCADKAKECQWTIAAGKKCALGIKKKEKKKKERKTHTQRFSVFRGFIFQPDSWKIAAYVAQT